MKNLLTSIAVLVLLSLVGCGNLVQEPRTAVYRPAEYARYGKKGNGRITGQAFLKTRGGEVRFGAGNTVTLYPVTSLTTEWYEKSVIQGRPLAAGDSHIQDCSRETVADGNGNFEFSGLPNGDYYLVCGINWQAGDQITGGTAHAKVQVTSGATVKAIVTE